MNQYFVELEQVLANQGFTYGGSRISPDKQWVYINIPKNGSSYFDQLFASSGWDVCNFEHLNSGKAVVILRDPVKRWVSGIAEYVVGRISTPPQLPLYNCVMAPTGEHFIQQYNELVERLLFTQLIFDDHTMPQYYFFNQCRLSDTVYYWMDKNIDQKLQRDFGLSKAEFFSNKSEENQQKNLIVQWLTSRLEIRPELRKQIEKRYAKDYELIDSVKFQC